MSRARNIKPGFFENELLVGMPYEYRLLFIGLWTLADREGRLEDRPVRIKMKLFPGDNVDVPAGLDALAMAGFIIRYWADDAQYIQILAFSKHQNPHHKEAPSRIPPPSKSDTSGKQGTKAPGKPEASPVITGASPADSLIPDSGFLIPEKSVPASPAPPAPKARGSRKPIKTPMPDGFAISERVRKWAAAKGHDRLDQHFEAFVGKALANGYRYENWDEALMNAIRGNWAHLPESNARAGPGGAAPSKHLSGVAAILGVNANDLTDEQPARAVVREADRGVLGDVVPAEPRRLPGR